MARTPPNLDGAAGWVERSETRRATGEISAWLYFSACSTPVRIR
jgi:hypothetical protein